MVFCSKVYAMKKIIYLLIISLALLSCAREKEVSVSLERVGDELCLKLDARTKNRSLTIFPYIDPSGKEYVTFQNGETNEILFYSMEDQSLCFKVVPEISGNNGVGMLLGYHIHNLDSIFLSVLGLPEIPIINKNAEVIDKIVCDMTVDSVDIRPAYSTTNSPFVLKDNRLYILPGCDRWATYSPMCVMLDLGTKEAHRLPLNYPKFEGADNRLKKAGIENHLSRCFNGEDFIYSFYYDEDIYVASLDHSDIRRKKIKSDHVKKVFMLDDYSQLDVRAGIRQLCEHSNYGNMMYDPYRDVYYRIAYPETEISPDVDAIELKQYGRKVFSIVIADHDFNVIGETLFPENRYNSDMMFICEDGLYISASHVAAEDFNDDELKFHRFELMRK